MPMPFDVTEDDLTNAIFYGSHLPSKGSGMKADARAQARLMLAAPELLRCLKLAVGGPQGSKLLVGKALRDARAAVALAEGKERSR
jgi:hypothetical protein